jgi:pyruvate dehydrogenase E1 component beta subunit
MAKIKYSTAIRDALAEEMRRDPMVFVMGEDVARFGGVFGCTLDLPEEFGEARVRSTPISEAAFVGAGLGASITGARAVVELQYVDFIFCAMDQLVNQTAKIHYMSNGKVKAPYTLRVQQGCGRGNGAQHAQNLESIFANVPGLKVVCPATPADAKGLLKTAIRDDNPVVFCEHKMLYATRGEVPEGEYIIPFGVADIRCGGGDVTIVATSFMVGKALEAAALLEKDGISAEVIDPRTIVPLDIEAICASVKKTGRLVIVHETNAFCGFGAEIAFEVQNAVFRYLDAPIERVCTAQVPMPYARKLENANVPTPQRIADAAKKALHLGPNCFR